MHIRTVLLAASIAFAGLLAPQFAAAQYPSKPIRVLVADGPGSAPDTITRVVGERLGNKVEAETFARILAVMLLASGVSLLAK